MSALSEYQNIQRAWVVFSGQTEIRWLRFLKPGFRHCYVLLNDGKCWLSFDPLSPFTDIMVHHHVPVDFDLPAWLRGRDHKIIEASLARGQKKAAPVMFFTCVEAVKRVIGIHKRLILTPWQLYRHLTKPKNSKGDYSWAA